MKFEMTIEKKCQDCCKNPNTAGATRPRRKTIETGIFATTPFVAADAEHQVYMGPQTVRLVKTTSGNEKGDAATTEKSKPPSFWKRIIRK